jgi:hypothetical protein
MLAINLLAAGNFSVWHSDCNIRCDVAISLKIDHCFYIARKASPPLNGILALQQEFNMQDFIIQFSSFANMSALVLASGHRASMICLH